MLRIFLLVLSVAAFWLAALAISICMKIAITLTPLAWVLVAFLLLGQYASVKVFKEQWENK